MYFRGEVYAGTATYGRYTLHSFTRPLTPIYSTRGGKYSRNRRNLGLEVAQDIVYIEHSDPEIRIVRVHVTYVD